MKNNLREFIGLVLESRLREADVTDGKAPWGSDEHIKDLRNRIDQLVTLRVTQKKDPVSRHSYSSIINRLRKELKSAQRYAERMQTQENSDEI